MPRPFFGRNPLDNGFHIDIRSSLNINFVAPRKANSWDVALAGLKDLTTLGLAAMFLKSGKAGNSSLGGGSGLFGTSFLTQSSPYSLSSTGFSTTGTIWSGQQTNAGSNIDTFLGGNTRLSATGYSPTTTTPTTTTTTTTPATTTTTTGGTPATTTPSNTTGTTPAGTTGATPSGTTSTNTAKMPTATEFNNAIDDKDANKNEKVYSAEAENTTHTEWQHTKSETLNANKTNKDNVKQGIRKGVATSKANKLTNNENADTKSNGYYKYITLTDSTSKNEYTYEFVSASNGELKYKLAPNYSDDTKDGNTGDNNWTLSNESPVVVVTIVDGVIHLKSSGDLKSATKAQNA